MPDAARAAGFKWPFPKLTLWERLILFFLPTKIIHENDLDGTTICRLFYKTWKGKIYIIREEFIDAE